MPSIADIARSLGLEAAGDLTIAVRSAAAPDRADADALALAMDPKFLSDLAKGSARAAVTPPGVDWRGLGLEAVLFAPRARYALAGVTALFAVPPFSAPGVHATAVVAPDATLGAEVEIGPFVVIEPGARIGDRARLLGHCTIGRDATLGPDALVHPGVRIGPRVRIGARAILHPNAVIGADGFSFVTPERGSVEAAKEEGRVVVGAENRVWARIASLGAVAIGDDVEIGANACVDRGTVIDTRIGDGVKIDNLVQIGHNVQIGDNCLLCGQVGVAGSARIGDRVVIGGKSGVADHATLGSDVVVMAASNVSGVVQPRKIVGGTPAIDRDEIARVTLATRRLPRLLGEIEALKKRFSSLAGSG